MCQLQVRDEVLTVNGLLVAQMSYKQWKSSLEEALQKGSLVMDVRRHGQHSESYPLCGCVCVCLIAVTAKRLNTKERFKGYSPGLTLLLKLWASLNSFDTLNWSVNYCEVIHE